MIDVRCESEMEVRDAIADRWYLSGIVKSNITIVYYSVMNYIVIQLTIGGAYAEGTADILPIWIVEL